MPSSDSNTKYNSRNYSAGDAALRRRNQRLFQQGVILEIEFEVLQQQKRELKAGLRKSLCELEKTKAELSERRRCTQPAGDGASC